MWYNILVIGLPNGTQIFLFTETRSMKLKTACILFAFVASNTAYCLMLESSNERVREWLYPLLLPVRLLSAGMSDPTKYALMICWMVLALSVATYILAKFYFKLQHAWPVAVITTALGLVCAGLIHSSHILS